MKYYQFLVGFVMCFILLTGCATVPFPAVTDQTIRRNYQGFSILPPEGKNWYIMQENQDAVAFGKKMASRTHTFTTAVLIAQINPSWKNPEEFLAFVKKGKIEDTDPQRFKIITDEYLVTTKFGKYSVEYHMKAEDRGAYRSEGAPFLIIDIYGYCCIHPQKADMYYDIQYSERGRSGESDPSLKDIGDEFINNFQFEMVSGKKK
jgi:hypothetical protein